MKIYEEVDFQTVHMKYLGLDFVVPLKVFHVNDISSIGVMDCGRKFYFEAFEVDNCIYTRITEIEKL